MTIVRIGRYSLLEAPRHQRGLHSDSTKVALFATRAHAHTFGLVAKHASSPLASSLVMFISHLSTLRTDSLTTTEPYIYVDTIMPLGILEPRAKKVPGTANVLDQEWKRDPTLKRDKTGNIILVPQPSEDPKDPLVRPTSTHSQEMS
jgi:hypothetical protein